MNTDIPSRLNWVLMLEDIDKVFSNIMLIYEGAMTYGDLKSMSFPLVMKYYEYALEINSERNKVLSKKR